MSRWSLLGLGLALAACSSPRDPSTTPSSAPPSDTACPAAAPPAGEACTLPATPEGPFCSYPAARPAPGASLPGERVCSCDAGRWLCFDKPASEPAAPP